jgi:signal transduction histidine kinase
LHCDLPSTPGYVDPGLVRRIAANLLRNAVQHTPSGTTIFLRCRRVPEGVLIVIEDDGSGIAPERRLRIFDLFERDRHDPQQPGLGVGLALVRRFAELHGGWSRVEPRQGGGTSFQVLLRDDQP